MTPPTREDIDEFVDSARRKSDVYKDDAIVASLADEVDELLALLRDTRDGIVVAMRYLERVAYLRIPVELSDAIEKIGAVLDKVTP